MTASTPIRGIDGFATSSPVWLVGSEIGRALLVTTSITVSASADEAPVASSPTAAAVPSSPAASTSVHLRCPRCQRAFELPACLPPVRGVLERYWIVESVTAMGVSS